MRSDLSTRQYVVHIMAGRLQPGDLEEAGQAAAAGRLASLIIVQYVIT
jgi:hypothetical protein